MRIAREGWPVIGIVALIVLGVPLALGYFFPVIGFPLVAAGLVVVIWAFWFFRDPERLTPPGDDLVISPADGKVIKVDTYELPPELRTAPGAPAGPLQRVVIFLNVFNVHVNRVPVTGRVDKVEYRPGQFCTASLDKCSDVNERSSVLMTDKHGRKVAFVQIAGLVARRIVNHLKPAQEVSAGERFGLIRFGSRAEIFFPAHTQLRVKVGDTMVGGVTVLGELARVDTPSVNVPRSSASAAAAH